jgi:hypothetical protein
MQDMQSPPYLSSHRIGFVSTRFNSTDGVSLETRKWAQVLEELGQSLYYFAGQSDQPQDISIVVPEAHFLHKDVQEIANISYRSSTRSPKITHQIHELRGYLKDRLYEFIKKYDLELLIAENALSIPLNIPLGLALAELIAETGIPVIGHHHDFFWERKRFLVNCIGDYLEMAFPPRLPSLHHVVISHAGGDEGSEYVEHVRTLAKLMDVRVNFVSDIISTERGTTKDGRKIYTLEDVYPHADLVTFPSLLEGFGNAFLEAVYYRRPMFVNNYTIYSIDIKPKGFQAVEFNGFITDETIKHVQKTLKDRKFTEELTERNYNLGKQFYSFTVLEQHLKVLLHSCFSREGWGW